MLFWQKHNTMNLLFMLFFYFFFHPHIYYRTKKYQAEDKEKTKENKEVSKEAER